MLTPCQYRRWQMPDSYRKFGPMPAIVQPVKRPPTAPAMNGQTAFKAALSIPAQSISSFMLFPFLLVLLVVVVGVVVGCDVLRALLSACGWDVWNTCDAWDI